MRQSKQFFFPIVLVLLLLTGCTDKSKLLVNTWMVSDFKYTTEIPKEMQQTVQKSIAALKKSFRLTYYADGTYTTQMNDQTLKGKWKLNWNSSVITATTNNTPAKDFKIKKLTANEFSFEADEKGQKVIFVMVPAK